MTQSESTLFTSLRRSDRTGGHVWTERVAETSIGKVRMLVAEDGLPLNAARQAAERSRLANVAEHPDAFGRREEASKNDEHHAKELLDLLPKAFLFDPPEKAGPYTLVRFRPNPSYQPTSMEERVIHAMVGTVLVDPAVRLHRLEGRICALD